MHTLKRYPLLILCFLVVATCTATVFGQAVYGSIFGTVTDASGAALPKAKVTITDVGKNLTFTTETNQDGNYNQTRLVPGIYRIKIEAANFKSSVQDVTVNVDTATTASFQLQTGAVTEEVTITAEAPLLKTDRADVATTFESRQVTDLPILDRNFTKLILLTPGTQQLQWQHAASENPQGSTQTMVNGQSFSGTGFQLDGTDNRDPILGIIVINPNFEAIGESKVTSQNYDAEFGQAIAGVASVSTKSGSNDLHGAAFLFRQNDIFQARNPFSQARPDSLTGKFIPDTLKNQFGGAIGGKIIQDRLFFFGDYEGLRSKTGGTRLLSVPTAAARTGDLSAYGVNIYDPATSVFNGSGVLTSRTQFAGNRIPTARLSAQALNVLKLIPLPNAPGRLNGTTDNYVASGIEGFDKDSFDVRLDYRTSDKLSMFGRYSFADFVRIGPTAFGTGGGSELVSLGGSSKVRNQSVAYGFDYSWNATLVTDFRFGFFRYKVNVLPFDYLKTTAKDAGINGLNNDAFSSGLFAGFINGNGGTGGTNFGSGLGVNRCNCPLDQDENQFQFVSNTTKFVGNHTYKFGADVRRAFNLRVPSDVHRSGELSFNNDRTASPSVAGSGLGLATFLLGDVTNFGRYISSSTDARERQWRHFYYGQDSWRANSKMTINYGLRLDVINPQSINAPGNAGFLSLETGQISTVGVGSTGLNGNVSNTVNFAPRLAFSYKATDKLVIRAGYGRSYDIGVFGSVFGHSVTQNLPVLAVQRVDNGSFNRAFNLADGAPAFTQFYGLNNAPNKGGVTNTSLPSSGQFYLPNNVFARVLPSKMRLPSVDAYNFTVQYQLTSKMSLEAAFVGNKGTHVFAGDGPDINVNQVPITGYTPGRNGTLAKPYYQRYGWTQDIAFFCNCADNRYNSLQVKLDKRFSDGYSILMHYTWQKQAQDDGGYFFFDANLNRGPAGWQRDHGFVLSQVFELPFGKGKKFGDGWSGAANALLGGWQFNSNTTIQSGQPFDNSFDTNGISDTGTSRPNQSGELKTSAVRQADGTYKFFRDLSVFSAPAVGTFGNQKRNSLRGPSYWRTDASLFKKFKLTEKAQAEFRIESVNLFNHVNLGNPDGFIGNFSGGRLNPSGGAGTINSTAYFGSDPQRNLQFALKVKF